MSEEKVLDEKIEHCWLLLGVIDSGVWCAKAEYMGSGEAASVAFDAYFALGLQNQIIGFLHTHPSFPAIPSFVDDGTMKAWSICLGRPLLCAIRGTDGLRGYWYDDEEMPIESSIAEFEEKYFGYFPEEFDEDLQD